MDKFKLFEDVEEVRNDNTRAIEIMVRWFKEEKLGPVPLMTEKFLCRVITLNADDGKLYMDNKNIEDLDRLDVMEIFYSMKDLMTRALI